MIARTRIRNRYRTAPELERGVEDTPVSRAGLPIVVHAASSHPGRVRQLGAQGVSVEIDRTLPVDATVELEFRLPTAGKALRVLGQVRWARRANVALGAGRVPTVGIEFCNVAPKVREYLDRLIERGPAVDPRAHRL